MAKPIYVSQRTRETVPNSTEQPAEIQKGNDLVACVEKKRPRVVANVEFTLRQCVSVRLLVWTGIPNSLLGGVPSVGTVC